MQNRPSSPTLVNYLAGLLLAGSSWLIGCSGTHESGQAIATPAPHLVNIAPVANVPALLGVSIDGLSRRLGPARSLPPGFANPLQVLAGTPGSDRQDSLTSFRTGGLTVLASYDARTRRVSDLLLLGHREDSLMAQGTLRTNARNYLVMPVFRANKPGHLIGLRIVAVN
ncbi:hypothetical protein QMK33_09670 [Hymenobacter sp. H14-R3]|uniref:hypothetical protein n=1 Tax=Hymenobacter sp. H14-R3 TaxID=3046308 RepID=UPI0024B91448|nr:hypothetical protein [Hymenobacter sp. H14-R3]MDJ0365422.1 hypothetical protein [Hymenobacter sp. H14-R3]